MVNGMLTTSYSVCIFEDCIIDPIFYDRLVPVQEWLDNLYKENEKLTVDNSASVMNDGSSLDLWKFLGDDAITPLFTYTGLTRSEW